MADEELSNEQLRQLLKDAEQRLKCAKQSNAQSQIVSLSTLQKRYAHWAGILLFFWVLFLTHSHSISKPTSEKPIVPYVTTTEKGAHVDPSHFVGESDRKLANGIRKVQDPVTIRADSAQVCGFIFYVPQDLR